MHFLCSPFGSAGDVFPMLGLALQLRQLGHRVTMLASEYFATSIHDLGLDYEAFGTAEEFEQLMNDDRLWDPYKALPFLFEAGILPNMPLHYQICKRHFEADASTVVITNVFGVGARIAHDEFRLPLATLHLQPSVIWSDAKPPRIPGLMGPAWLQRLAYRLGERLIIDPIACPGINAFRRQRQLPPIRQAVRWWHSPDCIACLFPSWFGPPQADWPANVLQTDFPLWDVPAGATMPAEAREFLDRGDPPWVFTPGSANVFGQRFFNVAIETCRRLGIRGILATRFREHLPHPLPQEIFHLEFAPFSELLPHCAGLVHHGGVGSMSQALAAGIPQVIVAMAHDQYDNAYRIKRLGVGTDVSHRRLKTRRLAAAIQMLADGTVHARCQSLATRLAARDGLEQMARRLSAHFQNLPRSSKRLEPTS